MFKALQNQKLLYVALGSVATYGIGRYLYTQALNQKLLKELNHQSEISNLAAETVLWMGREIEKGTDFQEIAEGFAERSVFIEQVYHLNE